MDIYAETILDHYRHPRMQGSLTSPTVEHTEENLACGDTVTLQLRMEDDRIAELAWTGEGCAISQAGMSLLIEDLVGKSTAELEALTKKDIEEMLGVPIGPRRFKCAFLSLHTLKNALRRSRGEEPQGWVETAALGEG